MQFHVVAQCYLLFPHTHSVADPGFLVGGVDPIGGRGPPMWALFGKNVCENERIGSRRGASTWHAPRSANGFQDKLCIGEELLLIFFKTPICVYFMQKMYISINLDVQIHHGDYDASINYLQYRNFL